MPINTHILDRFDTPIHQEQVRTLYQQSPIIYLGIIIAMIVIGGFFWDRADNTTVIVWVALTIALTLARTAMVIRFRKIEPQGKAVLNWGLAFAFSSFLSGILWGSVAVLFLDTGQFDTVLLVAVVLTGMCAGSLVPLSTFIPAYFGYCLPTMIPLAYVLLSQDEGALILIGYLVFAFIAVLLGYSFVVNRNLADSIQLRFENLELLEDLKRQKDIAEKANTDKSRFLAATSHDLRQPLHAMDLYLGALENLLRDDEHRQLMKKSRQSSAVLKELLEALMDISRLDAGNVIVNHDRVDVKQLVDSLYEEYSEQARHQSIELRVKSQSALIDTDRLLLSRMIRNLLSNAIIHSHASKILLSARRQGERIKIEIRDNGCGIPAAEREQIFSEFYQLQNPERDRSKGLGLGLAIVKRLSLLLHHDIHLSSEIDRGSCFSILVATAHFTATDDEDTHPEQRTDISGLFILFVEDELAVREAMSTLLKQWGCELLSGDSLSAIIEELDALAYPAPDLIISDYRLRDNRSGLDAIAALRQRYTNRIPAILITGDTDKSILNKARKQRVSVLLKPVAPRDLHAGIANSQLPGTDDTDPE